MPVTQKDKEKMIEQLFSVGAHYGYTRRRRHPSMTPFIFGTKNRVELFDLEKVTELLEKTKAYLYGLGQEKKQVLFVSSKHELRGLLKDAATSIGMPYALGRWIGGTFTNMSQIKKRIERLEELHAQREKGTLDKYTKREQLDFDREIKELEEHFLGLVTMKQLPAAILVVDTKHEKIAVTEAHKRSIPVIGILNSDCNLNDAAYPVVANDASIPTIAFLITELVKAYQDGLSHPKETPKEEEEEGQKKEKKEA